MNFHKFPKAQRELAEIEAAEQKRRAELANINYELSNAARVEATPGQISETKEEGAPHETQTKEKTRGAKKKT